MHYLHYHKGHRKLHHFEVNGLNKQTKAANRMSGLIGASFIRKGESGTTLFLSPIFDLMEAPLTGRVPTESKETKRTITHGKDVKNSEVVAHLEAFIKIPRLYTGKLSRVTFYCSLLASQL